MSEWFRKELNVELEKSPNGDFLYLVDNRLTNFLIYAIFRFVNQYVNQQRKSLRFYKKEKSY